MVVLYDVKASIRYGTLTFRKGTRLYRLTPAGEALLAEQAPPGARRV